MYSPANLSRFMVVVTCRGEALTMWLWRQPIAVFNLIEFVVCAITFLFMALPYGLLYGDLW